MCIFCKIIRGEIAAQKVYEDPEVLAFHDVNPVAPQHVLVIPKVHIESLNSADPSEAELLGHIQIVAAEIARKLNMAEQGYRLVLNCGEMGGQTVEHIHYHLIGGKHLAWPPYAQGSTEG